MNKGSARLLTSLRHLWYMAQEICFSRPEVFRKKGVHRNFAKFTGKHLCQSLFFNKVAGRATLLKKETLAQVFSCEFCEISMNTFGGCFLSLHMQPGYSGLKDWNREKFWKRGLCKSCNLTWTRDLRTRLIFDKGRLNFRTFLSKM